MALLVYCRKRGSADPLAESVALLKCKWQNAPSLCFRWFRLDAVFSCRGLIYKIGAPCIVDTFGVSCRLVMHNTFIS